MGDQQIRAVRLRDRVEWRRDESCDQDYLGVLPMATRKAVKFEKQGALCYCFSVTPEESKKLDEVYELTRENHDMLKKVRRVQKNAMTVRVIYWLVIVSMAFGAFYYIKPYVESLVSVYTDTTNTIGNIEESIPDIGSVNEILRQIKSN